MATTWALLARKRPNLTTLIQFRISMTTQATEVGLAWVSLHHSEAPMALELWTLACLPAELVESLVEATTAP